MPKSTSAKCPKCRNRYQWDWCQDMWWNKTLNKFCKTETVQSPHEKDMGEKGTSIKGICNTCGAHLGTVHDDGSVTDNETWKKQNINWEEMDRGGLS